MRTELSNAGSNRSGSAADYGNPKLEYSEFIERVQETLQTLCGSKVRVCTVRITRNNGVESDSIGIIEESTNISPAIDLQPYYHSYRNGVSFDDTAENILACYRKSRMVYQMDTSRFTNPESAKIRLVRRVINREKNRGLLQNVPFREFLDLAVVYYYLIEDFPAQSQDQMAGIMVKNEHLRLWQMDPEQLDMAAIQGMRQLMPPLLTTMREMLEEMTGSDLPDNPESEFPLFVLTNKTKSFGAAWITDPDVLSLAGERLNDDYYILPSSIHECILVPVSCEKDEGMLRDMVRDVNSTQVEPEEVLSDQLYRYSREKQKLFLLEEQ